MYTVLYQATDDDPYSETGIVARSIDEAWDHWDAFAQQERVTCIHLCFVRLAVQEPDLWPIPRDDSSCWPRFDRMYPPTAKHLVGGTSIAIG